MTEKDLLYYFPYRIDREKNLRQASNDYNGFVRRYIRNYDGTNVPEFIEKNANLSSEERMDFQYEYEMYLHWDKWYKAGGNIFSFSSEILQLLQKTDISEVTPKSFHLPYDIFYISLRPLNLKISADSNEIIEGVYIDHNIWNYFGEHPEGFCALSFYFVGNFKSVFKEYYPNVKSRIEMLQGKWDESPLGSFWNVWFHFEKSEGIETFKQAIDHFVNGLKSEIFPYNKDEPVSDAELDFYNSSVTLLQNTINLVVNCLLYLSQPQEKKDVTSVLPAGLPANLNRKFAFAKKEKEREKVERKIKELGFTRINFVGQSFKRNMDSKPSSVLLSSHWRRGHWRMQKYGLELSESKTIWIMPVLVNSNAKNADKGHVYDVNAG